MDKKSLWICLGLFVVSLVVGYGSFAIVEVFREKNENLIDNTDIDNVIGGQIENNFDADSDADVSDDQLDEENDESFESLIDPSLSDYVVEKYNEGTGIIELYINNKRVQFEDEAMDVALTKVKKMNDNIFIVEKLLGSSSLYVVNGDAKVIGVFDQVDSDYYKETTILPTKGYYSDTYRIEGNNLYIETNFFGNGGEDYTLCNDMTNDSDVVVYEEKFEYLGNNKFSSPVVTKEITRKQYMKDNNIVCK